MTNELVHTASKGRMTPGMPLNIGSSPVIFNYGLYNLKLIDRKMCSIA